MKFSKIVIGFAAVGFVIGAGDVILDVLYAHGFADTHKGLYEFATSYGLLLCPFSIMTMALEADDANWFGAFVVLANILALNTLLYGVIGAGAAKLWTHLKTPLPRANPH